MSRQKIGIDSAIGGGGKTLGIGHHRATLLETYQNKKVNA